MPELVPDGTTDSGVSAGVTARRGGRDGVVRVPAEEVRRSGGDPPRAADPADRRAAREEAEERLWPVSGGPSVAAATGVRGGLGTPLKAILRKLMRWYVEPLAYDQRSFNAPRCD